MKLVWCLSGTYCPLDAVGFMGADSARNFTQHSYVPPLVQDRSQVLCSTPSRGTPFASRARYRTSLQVSHLEKRRLGPRILSRFFPRTLHVLAPSFKRSRTEGDELAFENSMCVDGGMCIRRDASRFGDPQKKMDLRVVPSDMFFFRAEYMSDR